MGKKPVGITAVEAKKEGAALHECNLVNEYNFVNDSNFVNESNFTLGNNKGAPRQGLRSLPRPSRRRIRRLPRPSPRRRHGFRPPAQSPRGLWLFLSPHPSQ